MAGDMQAQFNQALREAEREADIADLKTTVQNANPLTDLKKTFDPVRSFGDDLKKSVTAPIPPKAVESTPAAASAEALPAAVAETPVADPLPIDTPSPVEPSVPTETAAPAEGKAPEASAAVSKDGSAA